MFKLHCFIFIISIVVEVLAVPPAACRAEFRWDDCGKPPKPVMYYWKSGSRCEIGYWRGCLPNPNMFADEYECINTCVFVDRPPARSYTGETLLGEQQPETSTENSTDADNPNNTDNPDTSDNSNETSPDDSTSNPEETTHHNDTNEDSEPGETTHSNLTEASSADAESVPNTTTVSTTEKES